MVTRTPAADAARGFWAGFFCPLNRALFLIGALFWTFIAGGSFEAKHVPAGVAEMVVATLCAAPCFFYLGAERDA